jgi:putative hydrolase of the HAD superfamily
MAKDLERGPRAGRVASRLLAIIFDGDDTLWLTEHLYDDARQKARAVVEAAGLGGHEWEMLERRLDVANVDRLGHTMDRFPTSCVDAYRIVSAAAGRATDDYVEAAVRSAASSAFDKPAPLVPFAEETLATLKSRGFRLALLTKGAPELQQRRIQESGLASSFDVISIVQQKTAESITSILARLGVTADAAISVGNSLRSDVAPSLAAGVQPIWIDAHVWEYERDHSTTLDKRVIALDSLRQVLEVALRC